MKRIKAHIGDVFEIKIGDQFCYGQVVLEGLFKGYAIFDYIGEKIDDPNLMAKKKLILLAYMTDNYVWVRQWPVLGNYPSSQTIKTQLYKSGINSKIAPVYVMDHNFILLRLATAKEEELLPTFPGLFERAIRAYFGLERWLSECMDYMLYEGVKPKVK